MKKLCFILIFLLPGLITYACPVCEKQQPKVLKGITHGAGPGSDWDYLIVSITALIALITLFYSVKWLIKPGEKSVNHIKYFILNAE